MSTQKNFGGNALTSKTGTSILPLVSLTNWSVSLGTQELDTVNTSQSAGLKLTSPAGGVVFTTNTALNFTLDRNGIVSFDMYIYDIATLSSIYIFLSVDSGFADYYVKSVPVAGLYDQGWNRVVFHISDFGVGAGAPTATSTFTTMRLRIDAVGATPTSVTFNNVTTGFRTAPTVLLHFDDGYASVYTTALPLMGGIKASVGVNGVSVGTGSYMSVAQLRVLHDTYGWDMCNHSWSHLNQTTLSKEQAKEEVSKGREYLASLGFTRYGEHNHFYYPYGAKNETTKQNMVELQVASARGLTEASIQLPWYEKFQLPCYTIINTYPLANAQAQVTNAIKRGSSQIILFHQITAGAVTETEWSTANFTSFMNWLKPLVLGGVVNVMTTTEWVQTTSGRRPVIS